jgi:hypothetical protein
MAICTKIKYEAYFLMPFANSDARIRFYVKFYIGTMLVLDMPPNFFMQAAALKKEAP